MKIITIIKLLNLFSLDDNFNLSDLKIARKGS